MIHLVPRFGALIFLLESTSAFHFSDIIVLRPNGFSEFGGDLGDNDAAGVVSPTLSDARRKAHQAFQVPVHGDVAQLMAHAVKVENARAGGRTKNRFRFHVEKDLRLAVGPQLGAIGINLRLQLYVPGHLESERFIDILHGKNIRERAMELIAIAHPKFRAWLIEKAKEANLIYRDQAFIPGKRGEYPEHLESYRTTSKEFSLLLRPVKISDEPLLKDFFYSLSDQSLFRRFISVRKDMPHERLQEFVIIDHTKEMVLLATVREEEAEKAVAIGQYGINGDNHSAEVALVVRDDFQNKGIGTEFLSYLTYLARRAGLLGFTAEVMVENKAMQHLFAKMGFETQRRTDQGVYELKMAFR